jgi:uncharacterized phage protein (TIGR02218 family)
MSYQSSERSRYAGTPQELFEFSFEGVSYYYTSSDVAISYGGHTYEPSVMLRDALRQTDNASESGTLSLQFAPSHVFASLLMGRYGSTSPMTLTLRARHRSDPSNEYVVLFIGESASITLSETELKVDFLSAQGRLGRTVPRLQISRTCPYLLYDSYCQVVESGFQWVSTVTAVTGKRVTVLGLSAHVGADSRYYVGGLIRSRGVLRGYIEEQGGDTLYLLQGNLGIAVGDFVTLSAGCDRTMTSCQNRFANGSHFGGHPSVPTTNPFGGRGLRSGTI